MANLTGLPPEIFGAVLSHLPNCDVKNLRLASSSLARAAQLRLNRVFLSPHPRDIQVLKALAKNDDYRTRIVELVYDDARFLRSLETEEDVAFADLEDPPPEGFPTWYMRIYEKNLETIEGYKGPYVERPDHQGIRKRLDSRLSLRQSYKLYQKIVKEQDKIITAGGDVKALEHALKRFPNLRRIALTPVAHGIPFLPRYETPMIRSLPDGFIYPIPRGWPKTVSHSTMPVALPWDSEEEKNKWRGVRLILRTLAQQPNSISEFVVDVNQLLMGLSCRMFDQPNQEFDDLVALLKRPNFSRIDLALFIAGQDRKGWNVYRSGLLHRALAEAKDLQHVSLVTGLVPPPSAETSQRFNTDGSEHFVPLRTTFPVDQWKQLRHFGLSRLIVKQDDLVDFLAALPPTLRSVELSFLFFLKVNSGDYRGLVSDVRNSIGWRERPASERPRITICLESDPPRPGFSVDISRETEDFVYGDGENPFIENKGKPVNRVDRGKGVGIQRNSFRPADDKPFAHAMELMNMGIYEKDDWYHRGNRW